MTVCFLLMQLGDVSEIQKKKKKGIVCCRFPAGVVCFVRVFRSVTACRVLVAGANGFAMFVVRKQGSKPERRLFGNGRDCVSSGAMQKNVEENKEERDDDVDESRQANWERRRYAVWDEMGNVAKAEQGKKERIWVENSQKR